MRDYGNPYITYDLVLSDVLPKKGFPVVFHGVKGKEERIRSSPSYFNILEASQPSLVSKLAPGTRKGAAAGVYNTTQSTGLALGGVVGGWLLKVDGQSAVFFTCSGLVFCWLIIAANMKQPPRKA